MLRPLLYILVFALLAAGIYFFIVKKDSTPFDTSEAGFHIKDTASVGKIFIAAAHGESITAERKNGGWILNGKYKALPSAVDLVLGTVATQEALYPVTKASYESAVKLLSTEGIKVELYDLKGKKMSIFYVGGTAVGGTGTNMLMEGANTPYVVQALAFNGDLRPRYSTRFSDWRDRTVFNIKPGDISQVTVTYNNDPLNSYSITQADNKYTLVGDPAITTTMGPLNTNRTKLYMNYFEQVNCEGYLNGKEGMDSVIKGTIKRATIDIDTKTGKEHADIYWIPINRRSKNKLVANDDIPDDYDADRMFAVINGAKDTVLIQIPTFRRILRKSYEFYMTDTKAPKIPQPNNILIKQH